MPRYDTHRDAEMRLSGTILSYDGKAIRINGANERLKLHCLFLRDGKEKLIDQDDPKLSFIPPTLGYINTEEGAVYAMRQPARRYKQGLDIRSIHFVGRFRNPLRHTESFFVDCLEGVYPSIEQCMSRIQGGTNPFKQSECRSVAFSKKFAIGRGMDFPTLLHRGKEVGHFEDTIPVLDERYIYLQECLEEARG